MELHTDLEPLAFLLGTWRGSGDGAYPSIDDFGYVEETTFGHVGKPMLVYRQGTKHPETGEPMHAEAGYIRPGADGVVEAVIAHPTGHTELATGSVDGTTLELRSTHIGNTPTAKSVTSIARHIRVEGDTMTYSLDMAAVGEAERVHLNAILRRVTD